MAKTRSKKTHLNDLNAAKKFVSKKLDNIHDHFLKEGRFAVELEDMQQAVIVRLEALKQLRHDLYTAQLPARAHACSRDIVSCKKLLRCLRRLNRPSFLQRVKSALSHICFWK